MQTTTANQLRARYTGPETQPRVHIIRETPPDGKNMNTPAEAAAFLQKWATSSPRWSPGRENMAVIHLSQRRHVIDWQLVQFGLVASLLIDPATIFRGAIMHGASAIIIAHNHPSGDPAPSDADVRMTREMIRAGQLLKIEILDHIIFRTPEDPACTPASFASLKELGHFYN